MKMSGKYYLTPHGNGNKFLKSLEFTDGNLPFTLGRNICFDTAMIHNLVLQDGSNNHESLQNIQKKEQYTPHQLDVGSSEMAPCVLSATPSRSLSENIETGGSQQRNMSNDAASEWKLISCISRSHLIINSSRNGPLIRCNKAMDAQPSVNGTLMSYEEEILLQDGDIITLLGGINRYHYKFHMEVTPNTSQPNPRSPQAMTNPFEVNNPATISVQNTITDISIEDSKDNVDNRANEVHYIDLTSQEVVIFDLVPMKTEQKSEAICIDVSPSSSSQKHVSPSHLESQLAVFQKLKNELLSQYECPVCMEFLSAAHVLQCGHSFCFACISDFSKRKPQCPICQTNFDPQCSYPNRIAAENLKKLLSDSNDLKSWESREEDGQRQFRLRSERRLQPAPIPEQPALPLEQVHTNISRSSRGRIGHMDRYIRNPRLIHNLQSRPIADQRSEVNFFDPMGGQPTNMPRLGYPFTHNDIQPMIQPSVRSNGGVFGPPRVMPLPLHTIDLTRRDNDHSVIDLSEDVNHRKRARFG